MTNKTIGAIIGIVAILGIGFIALNSANSDDVYDDQIFSISTSFYPLAFATSEITGDLAAVTNIGDGRDPHDFRPSVQEVVTLQNSDLVVLQGADFETWGDDIKEQLEGAGVPVVFATAGLDLMEGGHDHHDHDDEHGHEEEVHEHEDEHDHGDAEGTDDHTHEEHETEHTHNEESHDHDHSDTEEHDHGAYDPHTWVDPVLFSETVANLVAKISALDPDNAATYEANGAALIARLSDLDEQYSATLSNCTLNEVITSHEAFGYLGARYDFEIHSIAGLSTQDTPSSVTLAELREEAAEGIGAILLEENSITAYGETLARETGLQTLPFNPVAYVIPEGADYFSIMEANLATLRTALQCNG